MIFQGEVRTPCPPPPSLDTRMTSSLCMNQNRMNRLEYSRRLLEYVREKMNIFMFYFTCNRNLAITCRGLIRTLSRATFLKSCLSWSPLNCQNAYFVLVAATDRTTNVSLKGYCDQDCKIQLEDGMVRWWRRMCGSRPGVCVCVWGGGG